MNIKSELQKRSVPDILTHFGEKIKTAKEFDAAKADIKKLLAEEEYGFMPKAPEKLEVEVLEETKRFCAGNAPLTKYRLTATVDGQETGFVFYSVIPKNACKDNKITTFIHINFTDAIPAPGQPTEEITDRGCAVFTVFYKDVTSDDGDFENGVARVLCPDRSNPHAPGKIAMWAWAIMRIIDYVETLDFFDPEYLAVIGHSRLGKTTLLAAAYDERIKFACANNSGTSGDALARGTVGESVEAITRVFPFWFCPNYLKYANNESSLPFDQHYLLSLIAPRSILIGSAQEDKWADPTSEFLSLTLTDEVYKLYGKRGFIHGEEVPECPANLSEGDCSYHLRPGMHYLSRSDWNVYIDFIESFKK